MAYIHNNIFNSKYLDEQEFIKNYGSNPSLSLLTLNIQSINAKFNEFSELLKSLQNGKCTPDIICLQELWKVCNSEVLNIDGYSLLVFKSRSNNVQGGGVGFSRLTSFDTMPLISIPKLWNAFDNHEIKIIRNKLQFNSKLKSFFLDKLKERVSCDRLLCQACNPFRV